MIWWQIHVHVCMCSNCYTESMHATKGGHFGLQVQSCCMQTVGSLPPPKSIWVIPGSLGVLGIEEVGVGPLKSDFFFTEFSNRTLRVTKHLFIRIEEFDTH